ncbi:hypothetical protein C8Q76DRAFT_792873 [Earliella scabrosa]|nr:hypothetical protein C8Q76DRAFT_792873 [Earliella scabrosa]
MPARRPKPFKSQAEPGEAVFSGRAAKTDDGRWGARSQPSPQVSKRVKQVRLQPGKTAASAARLLEGENGGVPKTEVQSPPDIAGEVNLGGGGEHPEIEPAVVHEQQQAASGGGEALGHEDMDEESWNDDNRLVSEPEEEWWNDSDAPLPPPVGELSENSEGWSDSDAPPPPPVGELSDGSDDGEGQRAGRPRELRESWSDSDAPPPPPVGELSDGDDYWEDPSPPNDPSTCPPACRPSFRALDASPSPPQMSNPPLTPPGTPGRVIAQIDGMRDRLGRVRSHAATLGGAQIMLIGSVESRLETSPQSWESYNRILSIRGRQVQEAWEAHGEE